MTMSLPPPLLTPDEHQSYQDELERLRTIRDRDLPELLREARNFVSSDAAEEIIQIRDDRAVVDARIAQLAELLERAEIVADDAPAHLVSLGRDVEVEYQRSGRVVTYRVAGVPAHGAVRTVSAGSPLGAALLGRSIGDLINVVLPGGRVEQLRILDVRPHDH
jgi:transcription elongation factor GreA